ncbi:polysaccharide biosynthesis tyrosine autokinase [Salinisphaera aquimarina]|uniref:Polysaccharide biosynthesis tyrosine autokinase n=1 Tax=Salinisphaera aquimarina TaxID=2094031 RepID=A0ABV7ESD3_9GAMM
MNESQQYAADTAAGPRAPIGIEDDEIDLARLWAILWGGKWKIALVVFVALVFAVFYLVVVHPTYQVDALLQIQQEGSSPLSGVTSDLQQLTGKSSSPAQSEIPIIKSRSVLGETVEKLGLATTVEPVYFPVVGWGIASRRKPGPPATKAVPLDSGVWLSSYAWRPTSLSVSQMSVPASLDGKGFVLRALGGGAFVLFGPKGKQVLRGEVGKLAKGKTADGAPVQLFLADAFVTDPPTDFELVKSAWLSTVENLQQSVSVSEQGDDTGVIKISLEGEDRDLITRIVNSIAENYLRQNVEAKSEEAEKSLEFLDDQLPELKTDVQTAETNLANYREKNNNAINLDAEGQSLLNQAVNLEDQRSQLKMKIAELQQTYTAKHPALEAAKDQMAQLNAQRGDLDKQVGKLPDAQKKMLGLQRDLQVNTELYVALLNRAQQLRIAKAGTVGNVRIIDKAVKPVRSVSPKTLVTLLLSIILGGIFGCSLVLLRAALKRGINDPSEIESKLGIPVYSVIPFSSWLARFSRRAQRKGETAPVLARDHGDEVAVEALSSLRTSLYFSQMDSSSNVILITGPSPGVGKSFVSANLAYLIADTDKKVVMVDADMRRGRLHEFVGGQDRDPGLSQVLAGEVSWRDALREIDGTSACVLTTGPIPPKPSSLLMRSSFATLMSELQQEFDLVIVDAPPILAVTDAAVIAASVPNISTFLVVRAGAHPIAELQETVKRFSRQNHKITGVVVNAFKQSHTEYAGGYNYYHYEYKS